MTRRGRYLPPDGAVRRPVRSAALACAVMACALPLAGGAGATGWQLAQSPSGLAGDRPHCAPGADASAEPRPGCPVTADGTAPESGDAARRTEGRTLVLQSDGSVLRDPAGDGPPIPLLRPPGAASPGGLFQVYRLPPERPVGILDVLPPGHSASDAIATTQREEIYRKALDRVDDGGSDVTVVVPLGARPDRGGSQAEQEIERAQRYELIEKLKDRDDDLDVIVVP